MSGGGERIPVATSYDGQGRISLTVPGAYVDHANYPLTVDPAVGPVFLPSGTPYDDNAPDVAHDPSNGRYMIVWQRTFSPTACRFAVASSTTQVSPFRPCSTSHRQAEMSDLRWLGFAPRMPTRSSGRQATASVAYSMMRSLELR